MKTRSLPITFVTAAVAAALALTGCSSNSPLDPPSEGGAGSAGTIVIGSQNYYSNEIIAEVYAQVLEGAGYTVDRQFRIGQREVYLPEIEAGAIDLMPEYTGNLLQYWQPDTSARLSDDVYTALGEATPEGLRVLDQSEASDQDSYTVTHAFADEWGLTTIDDLAHVTTPLTLGSNSEAESRPYGPQGLLDTYGITISFTPIEDAGGPLTVKALVDGNIQLANIYSADPSIATNDLVSLVDTKGLFLASHVVPLASAELDADAVSLINRVSAAMSASDLVALNKRSIDEQLSAAVIAADWVAGQNFS